MFYHIFEIIWQCRISQNSNLWHLMLKYILMQWILELWSNKEIKHPCRIAQKHYFPLSSSPWRFKKNELLMINHILIQLDLNHSLKWMQYRPKLVDVEEIPDTMVLVVIIHQILKKGKPHYTIMSGIILRQNKKMGSI